MADAPDHLGTIAAYVTRLEARDWDGVDALLHPDVVYEMPQTRERIRGREGLRRFNTDYPGDWHLRLVESYAGAAGGVLRMEATVGDQIDTAIVFLRFDDTGLITAITDWWPEPYDPPPGRETLVERY